MVCDMLHHKKVGPDNSKTRRVPVVHYIARGPTPGLKEYREHQKIELERLIQLRIKKHFRK
jgi:hypothetical protein